MNKKILSIFLASLMFVSSISYTNLSYANEIINFSAADVENSKIPENKNFVLEDLIRQSSGSYKESEILTFIIEINDNEMKNKYSLNVPDIEDIKTDSGLQKQLEYARTSQELLLDKIEDSGINFEVVERYDTVLNAIALKTTLKSAKQIATFPEVASIEINKLIPAPTFNKTQLFQKRDMASNPMINASDAWSKTYTGKGQLIAVIDSGADPNHSVFANIDSSSLKIKTDQQLRSYLASRGITSGKYFNEKIPFGFNYADRNNTIKGSNSHGMHVAGIIAANSSELRGVAPDAQIAVMRVFSDYGLFGGGTTAVIYNKAIDDAVKLGVDSINMSLGSTGTTDSRVEQTTYNALSDAQRAGIVVAIAAGNDGFMGFGAIKGPASRNLDYGMINSPSTIDISMSVASVDNTKIKQVAAILESMPNSKIRYKLGINIPNFPAETYLNMISAGYGYEEDYSAINVSDKVVLIQRGDSQGRESLETTFFEKVKRAQDKGAKGVIIYNNVVESDLINVAGLKDIRIPVAFVSKADGELLVGNVNSRIKFESVETYIDNPNGYNVSRFSSWGMTPEGNLKPDISAPGGSIYSSINDGLYKVDSGTSMATPHVAGGIAIVKDYVQRTFPSVTGKEKSILVKNILMSTATPRFDNTERAYISPRGQGAGLMDLKRALNTSVVVLGTNNISSINLKNITDNTVNITGKLKNYSSQSRAFEYYAVLATDKEEDKTITLKPQLIKNTENTKKQITVQGNSEADFNISITLTDQELNQLATRMPQGFFLEGYVFFKSTDGNENVNIPFVGVKGNWKKLDVIEESIYDLVQKGERPYYYSKISLIHKYPFTHIGSKVSGLSVALGEKPESKTENPLYDKNLIAFSPNNDGKADHAAFIGTFLRNFKDFELSVYKELDTNRLTPIFEVKDEKYRLKNFDVQNSAAAQYTTGGANWKWDGTDTEGHLQADGKYTMVIKATLDGTDEKSKDMVFPIILDNSFPRIVKSSYDRATGVYNLEEVEEMGSGIRERKITIGSTEYLPTGNIFNLPPGTDPETATITISDYAYNTISMSLQNSIRTGNERVVIVKPAISSGSIPDDKYKWEIFDQSNQKVNPYNIAVGRYKLVVSEVDEAYELESPSTIEFEVTDSDTTKIVEIKFSLKDRREVLASVINNRNIPARIFLVDKGTGKEYLMIKDQNNNYITNIPHGEYKVVVKDLTDEYYATITNGEFTVNAIDQIVLPAIKIDRLRLKDVTVNLNRGDYTKEVTILFRGRDSRPLTYEVVFAEGENSKQIQIPSNILFDVFIKEIADNSYGIESNKTYQNEGTGPYVANIELVKGSSNNFIPVNKANLKARIDQANLLEEKNYKKGWIEFEIILDKAEQIYNSPTATQDDVNNVEIELADAIARLVPKTEERADKTRLIEKIKEAEGIYEKINDGEYDLTTVQYLIIAIQGANIIAKSDEPEHNTEEMINTMILRLDEAISGLRKLDGTIHKDALGLAIYNAREIIENIGMYKPESVTGLEAIMQEALTLYSEENATQEAINNFTKILRNYIALAERNVDKSGLIAEINTSKALDLRLYKLEGKAQFREALKKAQEVFDNKKADETQISEAIDSLRTAREALILKNNVPSPPPIINPQPSPSPGGNSGGGGGGGGSTSSTTQKTPEAQKTPETVITNEPYIKGYEDNTFRPAANITRAEISVLLSRFLTNEKTVSNEFNDIKKDIWYENAVNRLIANDVLVFSDDSFNPQKPLTRAELVAMIVKMKNIAPMGDIKFKDKDEAPWASAYIAIAEKEGWINGYEDNTFRPNAPVTRAEIAKIITLAFNINKPQSEKENIFKDLKNSHWAYNYIMKLI